MLNVAPAPVIFMHTDATDMRKSFTGLCGIIRGVFGDNPADGSLFLFVNKRRDRIKALRWEGDGFVIWYKRLEAVQRRKRYQRISAQQNQQLVEQKERLVEIQLRLNAALQAAFRKWIERYLSDPHQLVIDFGDSPEVADAAEGIADAAFEAVAGYERRTQKPAKARNEQLPAHLPRIEVLLPVPEDRKSYPEHGEREVIGYDWQETLKIEPPKLVVIRTGIPKLACQGHDECGVVEAPRPVGLVEGNRYDTSVAAQIVTHKYSYHLPIYRQQDIFAACGWTPPPQHAPEHPPGRRGMRRGVRLAPPGGGAGRADHRHRRHDGHARDAG